MHDREHSRSFVVVHLDVPIIREHQSDIGYSVDERRDFPRTEYGVELSVNQHLVQSLARSNRLQVDFAVELKWRPLVTTRLFLAAGAPVNIGWINAVFFLEDAAHPDVSGLLVFRQTDQLALQ